MRITQAGADRLIDHARAVIGLLESRGCSQRDATLVLRLVSDLTFEFGPTVIAEAEGPRAAEAPAAAG